MKTSNLRLNFVLDRNPSTPTLYFFDLLQLFNQFISSFVQIWRIYGSEVFTQLMVNQLILMQRKVALHRYETLLNSSLNLLGKNINCKELRWFKKGSFSCR